MSGILLPLLIIAFLPYLAKLPLVWAMQRAGGYNNHYPRQQQSQLTGFGQRCTAAHYNSFEALAFFSVAVLMVIAVGQVSDTMQLLAWSFVACRVAYLFCYWQGRVDVCCLDFVRTGGALIAKRGAQFSYSK